MFDRLSVREDATRDISSRTIQIRAASVDESNRSVEAVIATDTPVTVYDWNRDVYVDEVLRMDGAEYGTQVPLLENHSRWSLDSILGSTRGIRVEGNDLIGRLYLAENDDTAERAWQKVRQGHISDVSAGYRVTEFTDIPRGETQTVKGRSYTAGQRILRVATRWELREVSLVPIGADKRSKIRAEHEGTMNKKLRAFLQTIGLRAEATEDQARAFYEQLAPAERARADAAAADEAAPVAATRSEQPAPTPAAPAPAPVVAPSDPEAVRQAAVLAERDRVRQLTELAGQDVPAATLTRAINEGWTIDQASREFLTAVRGSRSAQGQGGPAIHSRDHGVDCNVRSLAAALVISQGCDPLRVRMHSGRGLPSTADRLTEQDANLGDRYRNMSAIDIVRECIRIDGGRFSYDPEENIRSAMSGASFSYVFSTNVYARLVAGWDRVADTTSGWCDEEDVPNFLSQEDITLSASARLSQLPRGKEASHVTASDSKETYKLARYAAQFAVDEQDILDDRLGAIMRMPEEMGEAARRLRPDLVYSLLLENPSLATDSTAVFESSSHANLGTAALADLALKSAISAMGSQRVNGDVLNITPRYLIVPAALDWTAQGLTSGASLAKLFADTNDPIYTTENLIARKRLIPVMDDRLGATGVIDPRTKSYRTGSATNWFLTAGGPRGLRVAYRRGTGRQPMMRSFQLERGRWGMGWDINLDIGAAFMDYRYWYKSTGAA